MHDYIPDLFCIAVETEAHMIKITQMVVNQLNERDETWKNTV